MHLKKLQSLRKILKTLGIYYYNEVATFLIKCYEGEYEDITTIDNKELSKNLDIPLTKASKILSNLKKIGVVKSNITRNSYTVIGSDLVELVFFQWVNQHNNDYCRSLNAIIKEDIHSVIHKHIDVHQRSKILEDILEHTELDTNIYQESQLFEFSALRPINKLDEKMIEIIDSYFSASFYEYYRKFAVKIKSRIEKIIDDRIKEGVHYFIYCFKSLIDHFLTDPKFANYSKKDKGEMLIAYLKFVRDGLKDLEDLILKNKLLIIINFENDKLMGKMKIIGPHVISDYNIDPNLPYKMTSIYQYGPEYAQNIRNIFANIFESQAENIKEEYDHLPETIYKRHIGERLYEKSLEKIEKKIKEFQSL